MRDLRAVIDVLRGDAPGLGDVPIVTAAVDHITPLAAAWYVSAPDGDGIVVASRNPAEADDTLYVLAPLPDGREPETAATRVRDGLTQAGLETADVSPVGDAVVVALALGDTTLMREALGTVPGLLASALRDG